ncbi:probable serine/threonine-protein kinase At1g54610 isoform X2 [Selaginella moellendorffii]|uniref:probable serine/threonine-protein kinase At1g54610 isoform X2 n=1 Tax=Selaginella moellendorffii TaxID=88036 RepID=UPI000D1C5DFD|nr:probable serine/threonine-protein kinase At1g54610 isoform X2 [Selaginella moellendorffii]|eukprot:XP_024535365.1 probable serine/threonine-protein kinase At1g54610 isoform X2 [Selaginella moellendorffii]
MGCICAKSSSTSRSQESPKAKSYSRPQLRHFNGSARIETLEGLNGIVEKDRERSKARTRQNGREDSMDKRRARLHAQDPNPRQSVIPKQAEGEQVAAGWPGWLSAVAGEAIKGWIPRRADSFEKLDKIGQGTYSNVYKARDLDSGKVVALKKVRFDSLEPESVKFMAREIQILRRLDHPNVVKLEGLVTSRMSSSLYLVFEYMEHDLAGLAACPGIMFTEPQVKCYLQQLIRGLDHCHTRGVLHRDIKGSNLLIDNSGILKIADFGLATFYHPYQNLALTSRVVTLWYRPPELLLGATEYSVGVDLWSTGCILAELLAGKPIMPGRTEVEQLHKIFKLCGSPSEEYWKKSKLPHATIFKPQQPYKRCIADTYKDFPSTALALLDILLAIEPADRGTAAGALKADFFNTKPFPCDPSVLPKYPPSKEFDAKMRDEESRRQRAAKHGVAEGRRHGSRERSRAVPAPDANAELHASVQKRRLSSHSSKSKSEKFTYLSEKSASGFPMEPPAPRYGQQPTDVRGTSPVPPRQFVPPASSRSGPIGNPTAATANWSRKQRDEDVRMAPQRSTSRAMRSSTGQVEVDRITSSSSRHGSFAEQGQGKDGDFSKHNLRSVLKAADRKHELDSRRSDVFRGPPNLPEAPAKDGAFGARDSQPTPAGYDPQERMYHSGPLLRPGFSAPVDIEELLEEHQRKLKEAVRRHDMNQASAEKSNLEGS